MEKAIIGDILRKRIKEKKYTQQAFAEIVGVKYSTLKKYMSGKAAYSYELLLVFSEQLDCSVDYLLGLSKSPIKEHHEISEQTRLSEDAIKKIAKYARHYDDEFEAKKYIMLLDRMIKEDRFLNTMFDYIIASKFVEKMYKEVTDIYGYAVMQNEAIKKMGVENDYFLTSELVKLTDTISELKDFKRKVSPEMIEVLKGLDTKEMFNESMKKAKDKLGIKN